MEKTYRIAAINLGSTSTKLVYYENDVCKLKQSLNHPAEELRGFKTVWDQYDYRSVRILDFLRANGLRLGDLDAVVSRGGHTVPIVGGVWLVNEEMLAQSGSEKYGNHVTDLGLRLVSGFSREGPVPLTVDPPTTDEFEPLARFTGHPLFKRRSSFHVLNHRAVGKQYANDVGRPYSELRLVVAHMGGGITVAAHKYGKLIDATNGLDGDGPFSTNRTGGLPVGDLIRYCYSGGSSYEETRRMINGSGGIMAYLGENDIKAVELRARGGDEKAAEVLDAMCYQTAKEIAGLASVLCGQVDAILLTGGIAYSEWVTDRLKERIGFIAPVVLYPGEYEMQSLALHAYEALSGAAPVHVLNSTGCSVIDLRSPTV